MVSHNFFKGLQDFWLGVADDKGDVGKSLLAVGVGGFLA